MPTARVTDNTVIIKKPKKMGTNVVVKKKKAIVKQENEPAPAKQKKSPKKISVVAKKVTISDKNAKKKVVTKKTINDASKTAKITVNKKLKKPVLNSKISPDTKKDKNDDSDVCSPKSKKFKKGEIKSDDNFKNEKDLKEVKATPKKNNPKTNSKSSNKNDVPEIKSAVCSPDAKDTSVKKSDKKKVPNKPVKPKSPPKTPKKEKVIKSEKVKKVTKVDKKVKTPAKLPPGETEVKLITENIVSDQKSLINCEKSDIKKENRIKDEVIDSKETIAKLLKEANKSILLKGTSKKKRDALKVKLASAVHKKPKVNKPKPKKVEIKQEYEEDVDISDIKQVTKLINPVKKILKKNIQAKIKAEPKEKLKESEVNRNVNENEQTVTTDDSSTSDELTLDELRHNHVDIKLANVRRGDVTAKVGKKIKLEPYSDTERKSKPLNKLKQKVSRKVPQKKKMVIIKKRVLKQAKDASPELEQKGRRLKLYGFWSGPKRHRVASLNALAKVHCLYENESRGALYDVIKRSPVAKDRRPNSQPSPQPVVQPSTRTLRSVPGLRGVGKHWVHDDTSSSSSEDNGNDSSLEGSTKAWTPPPSYKQKQRELEKLEKKTEKKQEEREKPKKKAVRKKQNRTELIMDLKDMVVRKRMASLNASAILAASYSVEKKPLRSPKSEDSTDDSDESVESECSDKKRQCYEPDIKKEEDRKVIEVHASPNKKVAVILNQDTDVTITGVYVNSTTRSTHHEGFCSIAGMQYRISATSHTQTNATAVATETLLHSSTDHVSVQRYIRVSMLRFLFALLVPRVTLSKTADII